MRQIVHVTPLDQSVIGIQSGFPTEKKHATNSPKLGVGRHIAEK